MSEKVIILYFFLPYTMEKSHRALFRRFTVGSHSIQRREVNIGPLGPLAIPHINFFKEKGNPFIVVGGGGRDLAIANAAERLRGYTMRVKMKDMDILMVIRDRKQLEELRAFIEEGGSFQDQVEKLQMEGTLPTGRYEFRPESEQKEAKGKKVPLFWKIVINVPPSDLQKLGLAELAIDMVLPRFLDNDGKEQDHIDVSLGKALLYDYLRRELFLSALYFKADVVNDQIVCTFVNLTEELLGETLTEQERVLYENYLQGMNKTFTEDGYIYAVAPDGKRTFELSPERLVRVFKVLVKGYYMGVFFIQLHPELKAMLRDKMWEQLVFAKGKSSVQSMFHSTLLNKVLIPLLDPTKKELAMCLYRLLFDYPVALLSADPFLHFPSEEVGKLHEDTLQKYLEFKKVRDLVTDQMLGHDEVPEDAAFGPYLSFVEQSMEDAREKERKAREKPVNDEKMAAEKLEKAEEQVKETEKVLLEANQEYKKKEAEKEEKDKEKEKEYRSLCNALTKLKKAIKKADEALQKALKEQALVKARKAQQAIPHTKKGVDLALAAFDVWVVKLVEEHLAKLLFLFCTPTTTGLKALHLQLSTLLKVHGSRQSNGEALRDVFQELLGIRFDRLPIALEVLGYLVGGVIPAYVQRVSSKAVDERKALLTKLEGKGRHTVCDSASTLYDFSDFVLARQLAEHLELLGKLQPLFHAYLNRSPCGDVASYQQLYDQLQTGLSSLRSASGVLEELTKCVGVQLEKE